MENKHLILDKNVCYILDIIKQLYSLERQETKTTKEELKMYYKETERTQ